MAVDIIMITIMMEVHQEALKVMTGQLMSTSEEYETRLMIIVVLSKQFSE